MPTYEYECTDCAHRFDAFHGMTEEPIQQCPKCNAPVRRLIGGGVGIIFKGSGFYSTDSRSSSPKTDTQTDTKESKEETKSDTTASETKSDSKSTGEKKGSDTKKTEKVSTSG